MIEPNNILKYNTQKRLDALKRQHKTITETTLPELEHEIATTEHFLEYLNSPDYELVVDHQTDTHHQPTQHPNPD